MLALLAYGIKTVYPDFAISDMLTEKAIPAYDQVSESCGSLSNSSQLSTSEMLQRNWESNKFVEDFFDRNELGRSLPTAPLLVISDDRDPAVPPSDDSAGCCSHVQAGRPHSTRQIL